MMEEMRNDCIELSITACEKFAANYEVFTIFNQNELVNFELTENTVYLDGSAYNKGSSR